MARDTQVQVTNTLVSNFRSSDYVNQLRDGNLKNRIAQYVIEDDLSDILGLVCSSTSIEKLVEELTQDISSVLASEQRRLASLQNGVRGFYWEYLIRRAYNALEENSGDIYSMLGATIISHALYEYFTKFPEPFKA